MILSLVRVFESRTWLACISHDKNTHQALLTSQGSLSDPCLDSISDPQFQNCKEGRCPEVKSQGEISYQDASPGQIVLLQPSGEERGTSGEFQRRGESEERSFVQEIELRSRLYTQGRRMGRLCGELLFCMLSLFSLHL